MQKTKILGAPVLAALIALILVGCPSPMLPSGGGTGDSVDAIGSVSISVTAPGGDRVGTLDFAVTEVEVTATKSGETPVVAQLTYDGPSDSWTGALEGLADGQ